MTTGTGKSAVPAAEAIDSFEDLYPRRVGLDDYVVLSLSESGFTAYEVSLNDLECSCADYRMGRDGPDICKHIGSTNREAAYRLMRTRGSTTSPSTHGQS